MHSVTSNAVCAGCRTGRRRPWRRQWQSGFYLTSHTSARRMSDVERERECQRDRDGVKWIKCDQMASTLAAEAAENCIVASGRQCRRVCGEWRTVMCTYERLRECVFYAKGWINLRCRTQAVMNIDMSGVSSLLSFCGVIRSDSQ